MGYGRTASTAGSQQKNKSKKQTGGTHQHQSKTATKPLAHRLISLVCALTLALSVAMPSGLVFAAPVQDGGAVVATETQTTPETDLGDVTDDTSPPNPAPADPQSPAELTLDNPPVGPSSSILGNTSAPAPAAESDLKTNSAADDNNDDDELNTLAGPPTGVFSGGSGTELDPYTIASGAELRAFATWFKTPTAEGGPTATWSGQNGANAKVIKLTADIDLGGTDNPWTALSVGAVAGFGGVFDGDGHTISGLYIDNSAGVTAGSSLFGDSGNNAIFKNFVVKGEIISTADNTGAVVSNLWYGTITNVGSEVNITTSGFNTGGLVGWAWYSSAINNCYNTGYITTTNYDVGGIVGYDLTNSNMVYENLRNSGNITVDQPESGDWNGVGGIFGNTDATSTLKNAVNTGKITVNGTEALKGALVGGPAVFNAGKGIQNSYWLDTSYDFGHANNATVSGATKQNATDIKSATTLSALGSAYKAGYDNWPVLAWESIAAPVAVTGLSLSASSKALQAAGSFKLTATIAPANASNKAIVWTSSDPSKAIVVGGKVTAIGDAVITATSAADSTIFAACNVTVNTGAITSPDLTISDAAEFAAFRDAVNAGNSFEGQAVVLSADIDLSTVCGPVIGNWTRIGIDDVGFQGLFDGQGHTISNLYSDGGPAFNGLFGSVSGVATLRNFVVQGQITNNQWFVAGVVAQLNGTLALPITISNVGNQVDVSSVSNYVGGVVGGSYGNANIVACYNKANITGSAPIGGVVGITSAKANIDRSYNTGAIHSSTAASGVGGVVGAISDANASVTNSFNVGPVSSTAVGANVGAVAGRVSNALLSTNNYFLVGSYLSDNLGAVAKTAAELKSADFLTAINADASVFKSGPTNPIFTWEPTPILVGGISISETAKTLTAGDKFSDNFKLIATINPVDASSKIVVWTSSDTAVATVNSAGTVKAVAVGTATITGTTLDGGFTASCAVTVNPTVVFDPSSHDGTAADPIIINSAEELRAFANWFALPFASDGPANNWSLDKVIKLGADIDLNESASNPGLPLFNNTTDRTFRGTFDGDYHTISGIYKVGNGTAGTGGTANMSLFGYLGANGTIKNLFAQGTVIATGTNAGGVLAQAAANTLVTNVGSAINGTFSYSTTNAMAGGVVGNTAGLVTNCYNSGNLTGNYTNASARLGGVIGNTTIANTTYENLRNSGAITYNLSVAATTGSYVGGIIGNGVNSTSLKNAVNTGQITTTASATSPAFSRDGALVGGVAFTTGTHTNTFWLDSSYEFGHAHSAAVTGADKLDASTLKSAPVLSSLGSDWESGPDGFPVMKWENNTPVVRATGVTLDQSAKSIAAGDSFTLTATVAPTGATDSTVVWSTSDAAVATVSGGVVSAVAPGTATITVTTNDGGLTASCVVTVTEPPAAPFDPGSHAGTDVDPYIFATGGQLRAFATWFNTPAASIGPANDWSNNKFFKLVADINLGGIDNPWSAISLSATANRQFRGTFDGDNHTISGLYVNSSVAYTASLFGQVGQGAVIKNFVVKGEVNSSAEGTGAVVSRMFVTTMASAISSGTIDHVGSEVSIFSTANYVGGIVGNAYAAVVSNCYNSGNITATGSYVGGVVGYTWSLGTYQNLRNSGSVSGGNGTGGIVGITAGGSGALRAVTIKNSLNTGKITGEGGQRGSFVGTGTYQNDVILPTYYADNFWLDSTYTSAVKDTVSDIAGLNKIDATELLASATLATLNGSSSPAAWKTSTVSGAPLLAWEVESAPIPVTSISFADPTITLKGPGTVALSPTIIPFEASDKNLTWTSTDPNALITQTGTGTVRVTTSASTTIRAALTSDPSMYAEVSIIVSNDVTNPDISIATVAEFEDFLARVNGTAPYSAPDSLENKLVLLTADIHLEEKYGSAGLSWPGIGNSTTNTFKGIFDGQGHTISGLYSVATGSYTALFRYVNGVATLRNFVVSGEIFPSGSYGATVVGYATGTSDTQRITIQNVGSEVNVTSTSTYAAGLVGTANYVNISSSYNSGNVTGTQYTAGLVGYARNTAITSSYNTGTVTGTDSATGFAGGIAGRVNNTAVLINTFNTGSVTSAKTGTAGALVTSAVSPTSANNYYLDGSAVGDFVLGVAKTAAELKSSDFLALINAGGSAYQAGTASPILSWQPAPADKSALIAAITAATNAKTAYTVSATGNDVFDDVYWVTSGAVSALETAIASAQTAVETDGLTQTQVDAAVTALEAAVGNFEASKALGLKGYLAFADDAAYDIPASVVTVAIVDITIPTAAVNGGVAPYSFTATGLPAGLVISNAGVISGTPTSVGPAGTATITVTDSDSPADSASVTIAFGEISEFFGGLADTTELESAITDLEAELLDIIDSINGSDVSYDDTWIPTTVLDSAKAVIEAAKAVVAGGSASQAEVQAEIDKIKAAIDAVKDAKQAQTHGSRNEDLTIYEAAKVPVANATRYDTMSDIVIGGNVFTKDNTPTVVLANGDNFPDALAASGFAGLHNAPIVLTAAKQTALSKQTLDVLNTLQPANVYIMGSADSITAAVATQVGNLAYVNSVKRLGGTNRYATALRIYDEGKAASTKWNSTAIVANADGDNAFADALSISPYAYAEGAPIFLSSKDNGGLSADAQAALKAGGFTRVLLLGSTNSVPKLVESQLIALGLDSSKQIRLAGNLGNNYGDNRYGTSSAIVHFAVADSAKLNYNHIVCATGEKYADALAGGAYAGTIGTVMLLVNDSAASVDNVIKAKKDQIFHAHILGNNKAISDSLRAKIKAAYSS